MPVPSPRIWLAALGAVVAMALAAPSAHATSVRVDIGGATADVVTTEMARTNGYDKSIQDHIVALIAGTPSGARIRGAITEFGPNGGAGSVAIRQALIDAKNRNVDIKVVHGGHDQNSFTNVLHDSLGSARHNWCDHSSGGGVGPGWACISSWADARMHAKFMTFSQTWGVNNVSWFGSANFADGALVYTDNNTVTIHNNAEVFNGLNAYFNDLWAEPFYSDYYPRGSFSALGGAVTGYPSPEQDSDLVESKLNAVRADSSCVIYISMWDFSRTVVANKLKALKTAPNTCAIGVVARTISSDVLSTLTSAGIKVRQYSVHDKMLLIHSATTPYMVLTGSPNLTFSALRRYDEMMVQINSQSAHKALGDHWWWAWTYGTPLN